MSPLKMQMTLSQKESLPQERARDHLAETRSRMQAVDRRDWWHWGTASAVMLLLIGATIVIVRFGAGAESDVFLQLDREQAVRGLLGIVLLFIIYSYYQQSRVRALRRELSAKIERLLSAEVRAEDYQKLSMLDVLTGLYNRRFVEKHIEAEIARAQRFSQPLTLLAIDLDGFKEVNDTFGHAAGDRVLTHFADRLRKAIRGSDIAVRMGGDEFLVLLPECTPEQADLLLLRLHDLELEYEGKLVSIGFSAGCAAYVPNIFPLDSPHELLKRADEALYAKKRAQKQRISL
jgi:diguanylate cyclase (GGDEF)-like protein